MTARWLFAICVVLLGCIVALALGANRGLGTPPHLPQLVEPASPAHIENMALQRDRPPPPAAKEGFMALPYFPVTPFTAAPGASRPAPSHLESGGWNA